MKTAMKNHESPASRYADDFEAWAADCVRITDKLTGLPVPFILNSPQRRVLAVMEEMRRRREPVRLIMLKARQWGGSTLIQVYMAWMQLVRRRGWNSLICAHVKDASAGIRGMYSQLLRLYPEHLREGGPKEWALLPYERSQSVCRIPARDTLVAIATSLAPNSLRGSNFAMAHLSEVAFWGDGNPEAASEIVRTVCGSVAREPETLIVMESTANGTGDFFHSEWQRAVRGESDKRPIFVGWQEIDIYRTEIPAGRRREVLDSFDSYERALLEQGIEAERVAWYHEKRREYPTHEAMKAEFPTTPEEAFAGSGADMLFGPGELPETADTEGDAVSDLVVAVPARGRTGQILSRFSLKGGRIGALSDALMAGTATRLGTLAAREARRHGCPLLIADVLPPEGAGTAAACAREALRTGAVMLCDEDENPWITLRGEPLLHGAELYAAAAAAGKASECSAEAAAQMSACRASAPWLTPMAAARLAAALESERRSALPGARLADLL